MVHIQKSFSAQPQQGAPWSYITIRPAASEAKAGATATVSRAAQGHLRGEIAAAQRRNFVRPG